MSYQAIITPVKVRPHPNADRLQLGLVIGGNQVVVGLDTKDGDLGIYFECDGQLSHEFCVANKLYRSTVAAGFGVEGNGFFEENRRVRAQKFRGEKSDGFWIPLDSLSAFGNHLELRTGDTLTEFNGTPICQRYETKATRTARAGQAKTRKDTPNFPKHVDTMQFRFLDPSKIPDDAILYITEKLHGTSGRFGRVWDTHPLPRWKQWLNTYVFRRGFFKPKSGSWILLNGSRNVILEKSSGSGWYGSDEFRYLAVGQLAPYLHKGEVIYFELVGWVNKEKRIMPAVSTDGLKDKAIAARYGKMMDYTYGAPPGECRLYVYKILNVNEDGKAFELSWHGVVARCKELGLETVPLLRGPFLKPTRGLEDLIESYTDGDSLLTTFHIREGVVLRIESSEGIQYVKNKSFTFKVLEGIVKEDDTIVDLEEIS